MDSLNYAYNRDGGGNLTNNRLRHVKDAVSATNYQKEDIDNQGNDNYSYDQIGNLISDTQAGITNITWNVYGKIKVLNRSTAAASDTNSGSTTVEAVYHYDANGNRIGKIEGRYPGPHKATWYVRDAQGNVMAVYEKTAWGIAEAQAKLTEHHVYGSSRLGIIRRDQDIDQAKETAVNVDLLGPSYLSTFERGNKFFELSNHLGNVLVTVSDKHTGVDTSSDGVYDYYEPDIVSASDYYPFGMQMVGRTLETSKYRYGYQGSFSEYDFETKWNSFELRNYDSRIGRWTSPDPYSQFASSYLGMGNNPVNGVDPDGGLFFGLFGSTSKQRSEAKKFAKENDGKVNNLYKKSINVVFRKWEVEDMVSDIIGKSNDGQKNLGVHVVAYKAFFNRKTGKAIVSEAFNSQTGVWAVIPSIDPYQPDAWDNWSNNKSLVGKVTYSAVDGAWVTAQNLVLKKFGDGNAYHIGGRPSTETESTEAGLMTFSSTVPIGKIPAGFRYLKTAGPSFSQARNGIWSSTTKPVFKQLENETTGQVFKVYAEIHHRFIPQRWGLPNWITNSRWNLQITNSIEHGVKDPYRYQFFPKWVKEAVDNGSLRGIYY